MVIENFKELVEDVELSVETLKEVEDSSITLRSAIVEGERFLTTLKTLQKTEVTEPAAEEEDES